MSTPEKKETRLIVKVIYQVHPRLVTVSLENNPLIKINLPITTEVYTLLLRGMTRKDIRRELPLMFMVNEKGVAYNICIIPKQRDTTPPNGSTKQC